MTRFFVFLIRIYQNLLWPLMLPSCRFYPSCSTYAVQALQQRGLWAGLWLASKRLLRCRPFGSQGYDPVSPDTRGRRRLHVESLRDEIDDSSTSSQVPCSGVGVS